ncbi:MAG TPA: VCBS repeat-containing protein [Acidobacteriaceae bacterium]
MKPATSRCALILLPLLTLTAAAQTGFHSETYAAPGTSMMAAPFTPGAPPDLLFYGQTNAVMLNDGKGAFGAPQSISVGATQSAAIGDLNGDGKPDIAYCVAGSSGSDSVAAFINDGNGQFHQSWSVPITAACTGVAIGDENKDGHADIVVTSYVNNSGVYDNSVSTYPGDGSGDFFGTPIVQSNIDLDGTLYQGTSSPPDECNISDTVGADFTGNPIPDLVVTADCPGGPINEGTLWLAKADGNGHFTFSEITQNDFGYDGMYPQVVDANHDGRPDVALIDYQEGPHGSLAYHSALLLNQGNGVMTYNQTLYETAYAGQGTYIYAGSAADFNNDGRADSVVGLQETNQNSGVADNSVAIVEAQSGGGYSISHQWAITDTPRSIVAADFDGNGSPDIAVATQTSSGPGQLIVYLNDSSSSASCQAPSSAGAVLCDPQSGKTYASPVQISGAGTAASGSVNHLELWVDDSKIGNYPGNTVSTKISLANGSHSATLVEVDNSGNYLKSAPVSFTVGSGSGACAPPSGAGAHLCSPAVGSTVASPVRFSGAGSAGAGKVDHLELWVDGRKIGNYPGSTMTASVTLASGSHTATLVEVNTSYQATKGNPVTFTVR